MNFTQMALVQDLARSLMAEHGLTDWTFQFDNAKTTGGKCYHYRRRITISKWHASNSPLDVVRNTILHEIAHAHAYIKHGRNGVGHNHLWQQCAASLGIKPERCGNYSIIAPSKYSGKCRNCGHEYRRQRITGSGIYYCPRRGCGRVVGTIDFVSNY